MSKLFKKIGASWIEQSTWSKIWKKIGSTWSNIYTRAFAIYYRGTAYVTTWALRYQNVGSCALYMQPSYIQMSVVNQSSKLPYAIFSLSTKIDVTSFTQLKIILSMYQNDALCIYVNPYMGGDTPVALASLWTGSTKSGEETRYLDVSGVTGEVYLSFKIYGANTSSGTQQILLYEATLE